MKKKEILITFYILFFALTAMAQSTFDQPWRGAKHTYTAVVTDTGNDNPVRWYVTTDAEGITRAVYGTDYIFSTGTYVSANNQVEETAFYAIEITWGSAVPDATNFYIYLEVDDETSNCTNRMALHVQIASDFNAVVYDVTTASDPATSAPGDPTVLVESCPADPENPLWDGVGHTDIGYSELIYRVDREFSVVDWQFEYELSENGSIPFILENISLVSESGVTLYSGTELSRTQTVGLAENYVLVYAQILNQQDVRLEMNFDLITSSNNTKDTDKTDSNLDDNNADHTILPMPSITGFDGN